MDNKEYYTQTLDLIKAIKKTTTSADILNILRVFENITTQNFALFERVEQSEKNLTEMIKALY